MDRTERFYKTAQLLHDRSVVPLGDFLKELGTSLATFKRDLEYMRERPYARKKREQPNKLRFV